MDRRSFMIVLGAGGAVIALPGCDPMPASAIAAWNGPGSEQTDPRLRALAWAMLAPNPHNLQSWIADVREPDLIKLHVDRQRLLPQTDPPSRQILIGCGAFVELLRMAAAHDGRRAEVDLFPEGEYGASGVDDRPFAHVRLVRDTNVVADKLFKAVRDRRTNRRPYTEQVPAAAAMAALAAAAARPGVSLANSTSVDRVQRIRELAIAGYRVEFTTPATWGESVDALRIGTDAVAAEPSGIPVLGTTVWFARHFGLMDPAALRSTDGIAATRAIDDSNAAARHTHAWVWLVSAGNSRRDQIESGRAYMRLALAAAASGLAMQPNSQVLQEFPQMSSLYRAFHLEVGVAEPARVQMLARVGYAERPDPAPRRDLARIVRT
jgi:hypothetical protein